MIMKGRSVRGRGRACIFQGTVQQLAWTDCDLPRYAPVTMAGNSLGI
jgi:hypothetical protein